MAQISLRGKVATAAASVPPGRLARPKGVGVSAFALAALLAIDLVLRLLEPWGSQNEWTEHHAVLLQICLGSGIALFCLWQYWRGRNWARMLVLLWSLATAVRALSFLAEHNLDPAALMGRPLNFFQAALAVVLLYWLNTPAVRAWYRQKSAGAGDLIGDRLRGRLCTGVEFRGLGFEGPKSHGLGLHDEAVRREPGLDPAVVAATWRLSFEHDAELILRGPWRVVLDDNLAFASAPAAPPHRTGAMGTPGAAPVAAYPAAPAHDELPPDSVPAPTHSPDEARRLLQNLRVTAVRVAPRSSDLFVSFEMGIELQTWSASAPAAGSAAIPSVPAADSAAIPSAPAAGSAAIPAPGPAASAQWRYSDPVLTVIADDAGVKARLAAVPAEAAGEGDR